MSSTKALGSRQISPTVSRTLKTAGVIIILLALLDVIVLPIPFQVHERVWQINFATQLVDRGIVPLVGIALLLVGSWVDSIAGLRTGDRKSWGDLGFLGLVLASVLGLLFILVFFLHLNNVRINNGEVLERINQEATQAETQLDSRLQNEVGQQRQQLEQLLANPAQLDQVLASGQLPEDQAAQLREFRQNPQALDQFVERRIGELRQQFQTEIGLRREQATSTAKAESLKSGLRVGLGSLLLAIGYIIVGWLGLRSWNKA
ncbi:MAG: HpsJ family protein [Oculatellaceae cyanobacterium bins.114]|nr:HpsJ family protein [Oculatellaceae cyanobacterium bins.114]